MKRALVTGAAGFVGRHLIPRLVQEGYEVCRVDVVFGMSVEAFLRMHPRAEFDLIVHLAANIVDVDARMRAGVGVYEDIALDLAVCRWVQENPPTECFIAMSSCAVDCPEDPYGWIKLTLEQFCTKLHTRGVPVVVLRPFSGYGGDQAESYPFPAILKRALRREDPLEVWSSVETVRDWIHIDDVVEAIVWAKDKAPRGAPIEIGTGVPTRFEELARKIADAVGYEPKIVPKTDKLNSSSRRVKTSLVAERHGFVPKLSLTEGIGKTVSQVRDRRENR